MGPTKVGTIEVGREARMVVVTALMGALAKGAQAVADLGEEGRRAMSGLVDLERLVDLIQAFEGAAQSIDEAVKEIEATQEPVDYPDGAEDPREVPVLDGVPVGGPFGLLAWYANGGAPSGWRVEAVTRRSDAGGSVFWVTSPESWRPIDLDGQPWVVVRFSEAVIAVAELQEYGVLLPHPATAERLIEHVVEVLEGSDDDALARARTELGLEARGSSAGGSVR
jgi:hypothetical protein